MVNNYYNDLPWVEENKVNPNQSANIVVNVDWENGCCYLCKGLSKTKIW